MAQRNHNCHKKILHCTPSRARMPECLGYRKERETELLGLCIFVSQISVTSAKCLKQCHWRKEQIHFASPFWGEKCQYMIYWPNCFRSMVSIVGMLGMAKSSHTGWDGGHGVPPFSSRACCQLLISRHTLQKGLLRDKFSPLLISLFPQKQMGLSLSLPHLSLNLSLSLSLPFLSLYLPNTLFLIKLHTQAFSAWCILSPAMVTPPTMVPSRIPLVLHLDTSDLKVSHWA